MRFKLIILSGYGVQKDIGCKALLYGEFNQLHCSIQMMHLIAKDFIDFISGNGKRAQDLYPMLVGLLGADNPLMLWTPLQIPNEQLKQISGMFLTAASIFTIQSIGRSGRAQVKMSAVVNFNKPWTPPKGVAGQLPPLGVMHHFRME